MKNWKHFTKGAGDKGYTKLLGSGLEVPKSSIAVWALACIDDASAQIGVARSLLRPDMKDQFAFIHKGLIALMADVAMGESEDKKFLTAKHMKELDKLYDSLAEALNDKGYVQTDWVVYGDTSLEAAQLDAACTRVRMAESAMCATVCTASCRKYMNRLSKVLYMAARLV